jgi:formamidopyrimidine-DNA glycosylase
MPEGHTLHRLARALRPLLGRPVRASSPQGRFAEGARVLDGRAMEAVDAFGKHLLADFGDVHLHVHLGLAGAMFESDPTGEPGRGIRLRLTAAAEPGAPAVAWDLAAPLRCELFGDEERRQVLARLGPDPLRGDDPTPALERVRRSRRAIGELLLDQAVVAGVGNVFRAEALHRCRVHPARQGASLTDDELDCLWATITAQMRRAEREGRIITVETSDGVDRTAIDQADGRYVYKQEGCRTCGGIVRTWTLGHRTAYACEHCQPVR